MTDDRLISLNAAIDAMMKLQNEDIEAYGASIPEGFDGDRAAKALKELPPAQPVNIAKLQPNCNQVASDVIGRQAALDFACAMNACDEISDDAYQKLTVHFENMPSPQPGCEDAVPRTSVEYICRKNTVSTNPYEHKYHDKFIQFMDDPEISDFGRWQHSNGFNTALVAVQCDLDKVPSVTPKQPGWIPWDSGGFPEESGTYTVTAYDGATKRVTYAKYQKRLKRWELTGSRAYWKVLAWQPLPKPYREGGQDGD